MKKINFLELGATLFVPATHKNLQSILSGEKYPVLKSVVVDMEDGIAEEFLEGALEVLKELLRSYRRGDLLVFLRPNSVKTLQEILFYDNILEIDGFVLPKFGLQNAKEYLNILEPFDFFIMPSIEGEELFCEHKLHELKDIFLDSSLHIELVRFGLEDMFRQLRMKNRCETSPFDVGALSHTLSRFIAIFKSAGFGVSGGVYRCFNDSDGFVKSVERDIFEGLMTKTIIHPNQIELAHNVYKVTQEEFNEALEIIKREDAVFAQDSQMMERVTMTPYAQEIILRAEIYGIK